MGNSSKSKWIPVTIGGAVVLGVLLLVAWRIFGTTPKSIPELFSEQPVSVEIIEYPYGPVPETVQRTTLTDPSVVSRLTDRYDGMPVKPFKEDLETLHGTATIRSFHFADGTRIDTLSIFVESHFVVDIWPDGTITRSTWGRPLEGFYDELGTVEEIPGSEVPTF